MWYVTVKKEIYGKEDWNWTTRSCVIEEHPAVWALSNEYDLLFAIEIPKEARDYHFVKRKKE